MKLCAWCTFELITEYIKSYWKAVPAAGVLVTGSSDRALGMKCQSGNDIPSSSIFYCHIPSTVWNICSYLFIEPLGLTYPKSCLTSWNCHFKVHNSLAFSILTMLFNHHGYQVPECLKHLKRKLCIRQVVTAPAPALATTNLSSVSIDLPILNIAYKWNHPVSDV